MKKPTFTQFAAGYVFVFVMMQAWAISNSPPRMWMMTFAIVNILFSTINLIGAWFATFGYCPWRDEDEDEDEDDDEAHHQAEWPRQISSPTPRRIIADSSTWTGR